MVCEIETWLVATDLIRRYGSEAPFYAATRADAYRIKGEAAESMTWLEVLRVVYSLNLPPFKGAPVPRIDQITSVKK